MVFWGFFNSCYLDIQIHFFDPMSLLTPACWKPDCTYSHCYNFSFCWRTYMEFGSWCNLKKPTITYSHLRFWRMCNFQFYIRILSSNLPPIQCWSSSCLNIWPLDNQKKCTELLTLRLIFSLSYNHSIADITEILLLINIICIAMVWRSSFAT